MFEPHGIRVPVTEFKAGQLLMLETGEYSDKNWVGPFRVTKDCDLRALCEEWCGVSPPVNEYDDDLSDFVIEQDGGPFYNLLDAFISWLSRSGYFEEIDCTSIHIGDYGRIDF